jgi:hypothetical protein
MGFVVGCLHQSRFRIAFNSLADLEGVNLNRLAFSIGNDDTFIFFKFRV